MGLWETVDAFLKRFSVKSDVVGVMERVGCHEIECSSVESVLDDNVSM